MDAIDAVAGSLTDLEGHLNKVMDELDAYASVHVYVLKDGDAIVHTAAGKGTGDLDDLAVAIAAVVQHTLFAEPDNIH